MSTVKNFTLTYDNPRGVFSEGDALTGVVTLELLKDAKVESLFVKAKGDANVHWSEKRGDHNHSYNAHTRFFKLKQSLIPESAKGESMPSSFKGTYGRIVYALEAKLTRSWKWDRNVEHELKFASKDMVNLSSMATRQVGATDKEMSFSKGSVHMEAFVESGFCSPGGKVAVTAKINNTSSKDMTPKFSLKQKVMFHAQGRSKHSEYVVCKVGGDVIEKKSERTVYCALDIPHDQTLSIKNCDIISVEYQLKVYLDISFSSDPEIKFPMVMISPHLNLRPDETRQPYPPVAFGGPSSSDFPPPAACFVPPPGENAYGHPAAFGSGYSTVPQQPPMYSAYPTVPGAQPGAQPYPTVPGAQPYPPMPGAQPYPPMPGAQPYPPMPGAQPAMFSAQPMAKGAAYNNPMPQTVPPYGPQSSSSSPMHHPYPTAPPSAPVFNPTPSAPPSFDHFAPAPTFNLPEYLTLDYDLPNAKRGFSEGDNIKGTLTFELKNDTKVESVFVKAKGEANVRWTEGNGDRSYNSRQRFFKVKCYVTPPNSKGKTSATWKHNLGYTLCYRKAFIDIISWLQYHRRPMILLFSNLHRSLPPSFKGDNGKIVYTLEAKITRSWRMDCKVQTEFNFFSRSISNINHLMVGNVAKNVGTFSNGQVQMNATMERGVYAPGQTLAVTANVKNFSNKKIRPKYTLNQAVMYWSKRKIASRAKILIQASSGNVIEPNTEKRFICSLPIPVDAVPSINNCQIISVEYFLQVYLDIKFTFDPEIRFPLVIVPPGSLDLHQRGGAVGPFPPGTTNFTLTYDNPRGVFSEGDALTGVVTLELLKDAKVQSLFVKAKGDANVHWSDQSDDNNESYNAHTRFFKLKQSLIPKSAKGELKRNKVSMPSSFKGTDGKIVYALEAKLTRSWKWDRNVEHELKFASKDMVNLSSMAVCGKVAVTAKINNTSYKDMTPKFSLKQKVMFHAQGRSKHSEYVVCKVGGDVIEKNSETTVYCTLDIPHDQTLSVKNCDIISVEYQLKVYLDISFSSDPEIKFPMVMISPHLNLGPDETRQPYPPVAFGGPSSSDFPPPAACFVPPPGENAYGHPAAFGSGYSTVPQQPPMYSAYPTVPGAQPGAQPYPTVPGAQPYPPMPGAQPGAQPYPPMPGAQPGAQPYPPMPGAQPYPPMPGAQPAMFSAQPMAKGAAYNNPMPQTVSPYGPQASSSSPMHHPYPTAPPSAPVFNPTPSAPPSFDHFAPAPTFNMPECGLGMNTDYLSSQQNEEPPSYLSMFPPPADDKPSN
ncbi:Arrestin domain-containing protein 3 [Merluccius polli]|uniref:Arrestin domain-containing protein 3 n=1 Tax=Merluccius polli TaxID=89951 RepID=A0AA47P3S8_MERPO|nr:Arrestin domain-containing protein 3 [Merluccius polli]